MTAGPLIHIDRPTPVVISRKVTVSPSVSVTGFRRRRFYVNKSCSTYRETFTVKMSGTEEVQELPKVEEITPQDPPKAILTEEATPAAKTDSHESSETENDLVHVDNEDTGSNAGTPKAEEFEQKTNTNPVVDLKFDNVEPTADESETTLKSPVLAPRTRRDFKEDGYDVLEPAIQVEETSMLTDNDKKYITRRALFIGAVGSVVLGAFLYLKLH